MSSLHDKRIIIISGPNGAGKTTFAREYLPNEANTPTFINADLIAAGLDPFNVEAAAFRAGRMVLEMIEACVARGDNFAFETTLSGRGYARMIPLWQKLGYRVQLIFLRLPSPEAAIARVKQRVEMDGHNVPEEDIRRRFDAGWRNLEDTYRPLADESVIRSADGTLDKPNPGIEAAMERATTKARKLAIVLTGRVVTIRNGKVEYDTEP